MSQKLASSGYRTANIYVAAENRGFKMADDLCADMEMFVMKMDKVFFKLS